MKISDPYDLFDNQTLNLILRLQNHSLA